MFIYSFCHAYFIPKTVIQVVQFFLTMLSGTVNFSEHLHFNGTFGLVNEKHFLFV